MCSSTLVSEAHQGKGGHGVILSHPDQQGTCSIPNGPGSALDGESDAGRVAASRRPATARRAPTSEDTAETKSRNGWCVTGPPDEPAALLQSTAPSETESVRRRPNSGRNAAGCSPARPASRSTRARTSRTGRSCSPKSASTLPHLGSVGRSVIGRAGLITWRSGRGLGRLLAIGDCHPQEHAAGLRPAPN